MADEVRFELDKVSRQSLFTALKTMDKGANDQLKTEVVSIVTWLSNDIKAAASISNFGGSSTNWGNQAREVATSVKPKKDRLPYVQVGGNKKVPVSRKVTERNPAPTVGELMFGNEFGAKENRAFPNGGVRFPTWSGGSPNGRGSAGWWIYPTLRAKQAKITNQWKNAVERFVINPWGRNG